MTQAFNLSQFANKVNTSGQADLTTAVTGTLPVANGGTGAATLTANNVLLGNGTSAVQVVAPGSNGNILTSNGTTWTSTAASGSTGTSISRTVYNTPATWTKSTNNPGSIIVQVQGGGGAGGGDTGGPSATTGGSGNTSSFGTHVSATGGAGGNVTTSTYAGGSGSSGDINVRGGGTGSIAPTNFANSFGGLSFFIGGGVSASQAGFTNSGAGGAGSGSPTTNRAGGAAGGFADKRILAPALGATEPITVGTGGAGVGPFAVGGAGASGVVIVWEYK